MKLLRVIHSLDPAIGGPLESLTQSSRVLTERGHEITVACLDSPSASWLRDFPFQTVALGPGLARYGYSARLLPWLRARRDEFDAVVVHGIWQYHSFGVWRALHGNETPYFVFPHGMLDPWFNRTYPLKHLKKLLYWPWAEYRVLRDAAAVLFTSDKERRLARESFSLYRCNEKVVSYGTAAPPIDLAAAQAEFFSRFPALQNEKLLLFLGRLHEKKGCDLLLRAFAAGELAQSHHLVLAGPATNDGYLHELEALANQRVTFTGMLNGRLKWGALAAAEAFILPSHQENFGIAVAEALACGTPVLISDKINIWREVVADHGGFAEEDTLEGTKRLLARWKNTPAAERSAMSAKAKECFAHRFEINRATDSFLRVVEEHLAAR